MKITKLITLADSITLLGAGAGFLSIIFSFQHQFAFASIGMLVAAVLDGLDGRIARWRHQAHLFGKELDSLADTVSFSVAPAVFGYLLAGRTVPTLVGGIFFLLCGIARLARFNIMKHAAFFEGVPITVNGIVFPALYFFGVPTIGIPIIFVIMGFLMVSQRKIKKW